MENVRNIANCLLSQSSMTHKKLQKLCYYAQAWYCALYDGTPLFADEIQAWVHGPVVNSLYHDFADYRWNEIPKTNFDESTLPDDVIEVLEAVYNTYGEFTGDQLESLTRSEEPWIKTREDLNPWETCNKPISREVMRSYYAKQYARSQID